MTGLRSWPALLRLAWRDVLRNKGRSALILVMIALPVLAVTAGAVIASTSDVSSVEGIDRRIGTADAHLGLQRGVTEVGQGADPNKDGGWSEGGRADTPTPADLKKIVGADAELVPVRTEGLNIRLGDRVRAVEVTSADLGDPVFTGTFELTDGRVPAKQGEILVNEAMADRGVGIGDTLEFLDSPGDLEVVGYAEDASYRGSERAWAFPGSVTSPYKNPDSYLVKVAGGVSWSQVTALNDIGVTVLSREVVMDPPSEEEIRAAQPDDYYYDAYDDQMIVATIILVITMAALEVILLAGPAFAVGARRMQRNLAQVAASGGTPGQVRRAVLATAVVLGGVAAVVGLVGGIALAAVGTPIAQHFSGSVFGPFDIVWWQVLGFAVLGWLSAIIAAFVPAWLASRQDVVKVLTGRRGDRAPGKASPVVGVLLFAGGVALAIHGTRQPSWGEVWVAASAILVVLGGVLLLSPVVAAVGQLARRAPLPLRYAARDAARHRTRTIPAIGAVMATVTGVVALGIANASDAKENEATYRPMGAMGSAHVSYWQDSWSAKSVDETWSTLLEVTRTAFPDADLVYSLADLGRPVDGQARDLQLSEEDLSLLSEYGGYYNQWIVADSLPAAELWLDDADEATVEAALKAGKVVLFTDEGARLQAREMGRKVADPGSLDTVKLVVMTYDEYTGEGEGGEPVTFPAELVKVEQGVVQGILPAAVATRMGMAAQPTAIEVDGPVTRDQEKALEAAFEAAGVGDAEVSVERGWQGDRESALTLLVLAAVGGLLMIGGTLTATFLALSDAGPDLATLSAVGAAPRERRLVAACYALVVGGVGAVLGAVVGLVPGVAATWPVTGEMYNPGGPSHYLDIPWLLILGVVVGLPLLTALVVGLSARSRLPLVARID